MRYKPLKWLLLFVFFTMNIVALHFLALINCYLYVEQIQRTMLKHVSNVIVVEWCYNYSKMNMNEIHDNAHKHTLECVQYIRKVFCVSIVYVVVIHFSNIVNFHIWNDSIKFIDELRQRRCCCRIEITDGAIDRCDRPCAIPRPSSRPSRRQQPVDSHGFGSSGSSLRSARS